MSSTASTVPAKRESFIVKRPEVDTRLIRRPRKILRGLPDVSEQSESEEGNILVEREDFHKAFGRGRGFSYAFHADEEAKGWTKSKPLKGEIVEVDENAEIEKQKKERKFAPNTLAKAFSRPTRPVGNTLLDPKNKKKSRDEYRKFMNLGPKRPKNPKVDNTEVSSDAHKALKLTGFEDMDKLAEERRKLLEFDRVARKRIKQLEAEVSQLEQSFESMNRENEQLRAKLNSDDQIVIETYQRVFEDRQILRKSEASYKAIITNLESQLKEQQKAHDSVYKELTELKAKQTHPSVTERLEQQAKAAQSYWDGRSYKDENGRLRKLNEQLTKENKDLKERIAKNNPQPDTTRSLKLSARKRADIPINYNPYASDPPPKKADIAINYNPYASDPAPKKADIAINYNPYASDPPPKKVTFTKRKSQDSGLLKKYDNDYLYNVREDFLNMLPDYYQDKRGFYELRS